MTRRLIVEPRGLAPWWLKLLIPIGSVFAAMIVGAFFLAITGNDWVEVYNAGTAAVHLTEYWLRDGLGEAVHLNLFGVSYRAQALTLLEALCREL